MSDEAVLHAIFNPEQPFVEPLSSRPSKTNEGDGTRPVDASEDTCPVGEGREESQYQRNQKQFDKTIADVPACASFAAHVSASTEAADALETELCAIEMAAVRLAETGDLARAVQVLTDLLARAPGRPSALNNRAQVLQVRRMATSTLFSTSS